MRPPKQLARGLTLPEVLVSAFLLALLLGIVARFFQIGQRITTEELARNKAEAVLLTALTKFRRDLTTASAPGLSLAANGETLLIHPLTLSDVGSVVFENLLVLWAFTPAEQTVRRTEARTYSGFLFDGTPYRAGEPVLAGLSGSPEFKTAAIFKGFTKFKLESNSQVPAPFIGSPLRLEAEIEIPGQTERKKITLREVFHLRNSGG